MADRDDTLHGTRLVVPGGLGHNRITGTLLGWLVAHLDPENPRPPRNWPFAPLAWIKVKDVGARALLLAQGLMKFYESAALGTYADGHHWQAWVEVQGDWIYALHTKKKAGAREICMLPNERGGLTLMFPEDR